MPAAVVLERVLPGRDLANRLTARSIRLLVRALGVRVEVVGADRLPPGRRFVFVPNHRSVFDVMAMCVAWPRIRVAGTRRWVEKPIIGSAMRAMGSIAIEQENRMAGMRELRALAPTAVGNGLVVFPEGHRSRDGKVLPFQSGAFMMAIEAGCPVVPVVIRGSEQVMPADGNLATHPGRIVVEFLDPIPTADLSQRDRHRLAGAARAAIVERLEDEELVASSVAAAG